MVAFRIAAKTCGPEPFRTRHWSSRNVTSLTQCSRFSMPQWSRESFKRSAPVARARLRLVTAWTTSRLSRAPIFRTRSMRHTCFSPGQSV